MKKYLENCDQEVRKAQLRKAQQKFQLKKK